MLVRILIFAAIGAILGLVIQALRNRGPRRLFTIRVFEDRVKIDGHVPTHAHSAVIGFIDTLRLGPGAIVYGVEHGKTDFAVRANPVVTDEKLAQLRDFLKSH
ncbi:MAG: hypothetical protein EP329_15855 [Deltaproteobacteria bacterium]|nr:MAG: hypothetical protein EP329_15855 [Deltaproteobacteria bacterium]